MCVVFCSGYKSYVQSLNQDTSDSRAMLYASFFFKYKVSKFGNKESFITVVKMFKNSLIF